MSRDRHALVSAVVPIATTGLMAFKESNVESALAKALPLTIRPSAAVRR